MTSSGSYKSTSLKDAEREFDRLRSQAQRMYPLEKKILTECGLKPHHDLLEIGCGPGFNTPLLCELVQEGSVTSCDNDEALLNRCRSEKKGSPKRGFQTLLSTDKAVPAPDESSDFSYLRFVLQHTPARHSILSEAARILRPGGILCVLDSDDGTIFAASGRSICHTSRHASAGDASTARWRPIGRTQSFRNAFGTGTRICRLPSLQLHSDRYSLCLARQYSPWV